jgi:hypothetical protein
MGGNSINIYHLLIYIYVSFEWNCNLLKAGRMDQGTAEI